MKESVKEITASINKAYKLIVDPIDMPHSGFPINSKYKKFTKKQERLKCRCGSVGKIFDTGKKFYVKCPACGLKSSPKEFEKPAVDSWVKLNSRSSS